MSGDWGALIVQFAVTAIVVLALIGVAYWLVQRYSAVGLGRIGRGRVPRLAIVDAVSVDGRRKLVLIRRDNIEHLLLIGGPADVVVEQAIQRPRKAKGAEADAPATAGDIALQDLLPTPPAPAASVMAASGRPQAAPSSYNGNGATSPSTDKSFSFRRTTPVPPPKPAAEARPEVSAPPPPPPSSSPSPARFIDINRPTAIEPAPNGNGVSMAAEEIEPAFPDLPTADLPPLNEEPATNGVNGYAAARSSYDSGEAGPAPQPRSPYAKPSPPPLDDTRGKLADLENEMARLLGEITQKRPS